MKMVPKAEKAWAQIAACVQSWMSWCVYKGHAACDRAALAEDYSDPCCLACWPWSLNIIIFFCSAFWWLTCSQNSIFLTPPALTTEVLEPVGMRDSCFLVPQSKLHQLSTYYRLMRDPEPCHENQKVKSREASTFRAVCVLTVTIRTATSSVAFFACCCPIFEVKGNRWLERLDGLKAKDSMSLSTAVLESPRFFKFWPWPMDSNVCFMNMTMRFRHV